MRERFVYSMLLMLKLASRSFYRFDVAWIGKVPPDPWANLRLVLFMNHTSLFEPLFAGWTPAKFLKTLSFQGVLPVADKTIRRPLVGSFFKMVAQNVVAVSRKRDHTWKRFLDSARPNSMVIMAPEGRMKRRNGLDSKGFPMTIRGGAADLLEGLTSGRMLIAYSGGLHHVQYPSQICPKLFKTLRMQVENLDIVKYKELIYQKKRDALSFKQALIQDLQARMKHHCPKS